ncbi:hypothetical protein CLV63_11227 [Murinocardiopsis flavida]|uniref:Uncharacterized protein n=1 Tax=Murinocardiopsis flavida TaxID=645275 RepID=A0A2P8DG01_9ACTN|nr:hypothetical protein [Murinocardiopsis flavida]PSK96145.1 hypothetical protein CLV63_11227 [Murinocardiopsis flavida]
MATTQNPPWEHDLDVRFGSEALADVYTDARCLDQPGLDEASLTDSLHRRFEVALKSRDGDGAFAGAGTARVMAVHTRHRSRCRIAGEIAEGDILTLTIRVETIPPGTANRTVYEALTEAVETTTVPARIISSPYVVHVGFRAEHDQPDFPHWTDPWWNA